MAQGTKFSMLLAVKTLGAQGIKRLGNSMQGLAGKVKNVKLTFDGLAKAYVALRVVQDALNVTVQRAESERRLKLLSEGFDNLASVQNAASAASEKFGISQTQANKEFAQIYARLRPIGLELEDIRTVYEGFNTAAKLSGTTASEASGAFLQLSQALGTGVLRGQELNSVFEQTPAVVQAIAKEMGVPVGQMRDLAKQGKVTIDYILPALERLRTEGAEKLTEAMKGPEQQFRDLKIAIDELKITAVQDNLEGITKVVNALEFGVDRLNAVLKSKELQGFMKFMTFGFGGNPMDDPDFVSELEKNRARRDGQFNTPGNVEQTGQIVGRHFRPEVIDEVTESVKKLNSEWARGAVEGLDKYKNGLKDIATRVSDMVVNAFKKMEDSLVDFVMTGKLEFKSLADSILRDMARIAIQEAITAPLTGWVKGIFSAKGNVFEDGQHVTEYAKGGVINSPHFKYMANGGIAVAGEKGSEAILPLKRRNGILGVEGGGSNTSVVVNVDAQGTSVQGEEEEGRMLGKLIASSVQSILVQEKRPGGLLAS
tara:strand:- start:9464 stop:11086 length:1623 start_codon:yes stop_codon:yes gene_type:complete